MYDAAGWRRPRRMGVGMVPRRLRLGLIVPADCQVDDEMWALADPGANLLITRTRMPVFGSDTELSMAALTALAESDDLEDAADRLRAVAPEAAAYVDTSITFVRGPGGDTDISGRIHRLLDCPTTVTSTAVVAALQELDVRTVATLTPYGPEVNAALARFFGHHGITVRRVAQLGRSYDAGYTSTDMATIDPEELIDAAVGLSDTRDDALFISCTALRTLGAIRPIEDRIRKPVITAIQATMWHVQRLADLKPHIPSGGRLFEPS